MKTVSQFFRAAQDTQRNGVVGSMSIDRYFSVQRGLAVICRVPRGTAQRGTLGGRGEITGFSADSARRMRRYLRNSVADYKGFVTLTYPHAYTSNGVEVKEHLRRFGQEVLRKWKRENGEDRRRGLFWFLEFQARGAPHFHVFVTDWLSKDWVSETWYRIVGSDDVRHLHYGTNIQTIRSGRSGTIAYASKYAAKAEQKQVPAGYEKVGRWWGIMGCRAVVVAATRICGEHMQSERVRARVRVIEDVFYGAVDDGDAEVIRSNEKVLVIRFSDDAIRRRLTQKLWVLKSVESAEYPSPFYADLDLDPTGPELHDFADGYLVRCRNDGSV